MKSLAYISGLMAIVIPLASATLAQGVPTASHPAPKHQKVVHKAIPKKASGLARRPIFLKAVTLVTAPRSAAQIERGKQDYAVITRGEEALKAGDTAGAIAAFLEAKQSETESLLALIRLAEVYTKVGQTNEAIAAYRQLIYPPQGQDWSHANQLRPSLQMNFSLLLLQTGQEAEALAAYRRALATLNYDQGHPKAVMLPDIGPGGLPYSAKLLRAMDCLGIGVDEFDGPKLKEAVQLAPDSAEANYFLGKYLCSCNDSSARGPLELAIQLGDARTAEAAKAMLPLCH